MGSKEQGVYRLRGITRNYDWGGTQFLSDLLSIPNPQLQPMAEYWLGAHDTASSILVNRGDVPLNEFIAKDKDRTLGTTVAKRFGRLPYLLKILDVRDMLSIQVHPSKHMAEVEFEKENNEKIPLDAPHRNYRDDNHKPELMVALSNFWLLHGFKPVEQLRNTLRSISEWISLVAIFDETGYDQLYKTVMEMPQRAVNELLGPLLARIIPLYQKGGIKKSHEDFWAARAALTFNEPEKVDRGIFSIYFFNLVELKPGEGIFQDSGVPHAYLEGQNVEIMANSDNVLRGGLTAKHISVKELMKNVKFEETRPEIIHPVKAKDLGRHYRTAAPDFKLCRFELEGNDHVALQSVTGEIVLVVDGDVVLSSPGGANLELHKGEAAFIMAHEQLQLIALSRADLYWASVPVHSRE